MPGAGALGEQRCPVTADHLDAWPLGELCRQTGCLPVWEEIDWTAGFDIHEDGAVVAALAHGVLDRQPPCHGHQRERRPDRARRQLPVSPPSSLATPIPDGCQARKQATLLL